VEISNDLKFLIEHFACATHGQYAKIVNVDSDQFKISCCCAEFKVECFLIIKNAMNTLPKETNNDSIDKGIAD
jgi:hypothetical protein